MVVYEAPVSNLGCYGKCCKWLLYIFNILFVVGGISGVGVGVWAIIDDTSNRVVVLINSELYITAGLVLIAACAAATFLSFVGCCGARYENRCLLIVYSVFLLLIFVLEFSAGIIALALYTQAGTFANMEMRDAVIEKYGQGNQVEATDALNYFQRNFDCCGFEGDGHEAAQLYQISRWFDNSLLKVPPSCCQRDENEEAVNLLSCQDKLNNDMTYVNNVGCQPAVVDQAVRFATYLAFCGIFNSLLQLVGMILSFCLIRLI